MFPTYTWWLEFESPDPSLKTRNCGTSHNLGGDKRIPKVPGPPSLAYAVETNKDCQTRWKMRPNTWGFPLTTTLMPSLHSFTLTQRMQCYPSAFHVIGDHPPKKKSFTPVFEIVLQVGLQLKIYDCLSLPGNWITDIYHHKQLFTTVYYFGNANFRNCILTSITKLSHIIKVKFPKMKDWNAVLFLFFQDRTLL